MSKENASDVQASPLVKRNRFTMLLLLAVFAAPVLLAYTAFWTGWFSGGVTNRGELLDTPPHIEQYPLTLENGSELAGEQLETKWWLIYVAPQQGCDSNCQRNLFVLQQTHTALGKERARVNELVIHSSRVPLEQSRTELPAAAAIMQDNALWPQRTVQERILQPLPANHFYLVDPLGNVILRYQPSSNDEESVERSKDMMKDVKRLLRYSRIG